MRQVSVSRDLLSHAVTGVAVIPFATTKGGKLPTHHVSVLTDFFGGGTDARRETEALNSIPMATLRRRIYVADCSAENVSTSFSRILSSSGAWARTVT